MPRAVKLGCVLLLAITCHAQSRPPTPTVGIGVAVMQNVSTRPFPGRNPRDRLVHYLNNQQAKRGEPAIEAIPLEATSRAAAQTEASGKNCDYVVFTTLVSLQAVEGPGKLRVGIDPAPQPPGPPYAKSPAYIGVMKFEVVRAGGAAVESTVRSVQRITADDLVAVLMSQVAERVRKEIGKRHKRAGLPGMRGSGYHAR